LRTEQANRARERGYWNSLGDQWLATGKQQIWRQHHDAVVRTWVSRWLEASLPTRVLKTDLFEEATGEGVVPTGAEARFSVVGIDISASIVAAASRHPNIHAQQADVRDLPFEDQSFDGIVSTSTLDHFGTFGELRRAFAELVRVLAPGGQLLITLDNLSNPVVRLRNMLPHASLERLGLVPYKMGVSCSRGRLKRLLDEFGLTVTELTTILHCPRVVMVHGVEWLGPLSDSPRFAHGLGWMLDSWETLQGWPTRFQTGYYLAARAVRSA